MLQERSRATIEYEHKLKAHGRVGYGYFEYPDGTWTWLGPNHRLMRDVYMGWYAPFECDIEREIDRRILIVAMGA